MDCSNRNKGFTLIELLIAVVIISVLASIALPTFVRQRDKARQSEGMSRVASHAKLQLLRYAEFDNFVTEDSNYYLLGVEAERNTSNYGYSFLPIFGAEGKEIGVVSRATPKREIKAFMSIIGRVFRGNQGTRSMVTVYCQSKLASEDMELNLDDVDFFEGTPEAGGGKVGCKGRAVKVNH